MTEKEKRDVFVGVIIVLVLIILYLLWRKRHTGQAVFSAPNFVNGPQWAGGSPFDLPPLSVPPTPAYNIGQNTVGGATCACGTNTVG